MVKDCKGLNLQTTAAVAPARAAAICEEAAEKTLGYHRRFGWYLQATVGAFGVAAVDLQLEEAQEDTAGMGQMGGCGWETRWKMSPGFANGGDQSLQSCRPLTSARFGFYRGLFRFGRKYGYATRC